MTSAPADLPLEPRVFSLRRADFDSGTTVTWAFVIANTSESAVLHVRFFGGGATVLPEEAALAPGETQNAVLSVRAAGAKQSGAATVSVSVAATYLSQTTAPVKIEGALTVRLPVATCPNCARIVADDDADAGVPPVCPFCFERLRACPVCGLPNSWLARVCVNDPSHVVRAASDFAITPGGDANRAGLRAETAAMLSLSRRWSFPMVAPVSRDAVLAFTAPVAAYGLVAVAASDINGTAHLFAWDIRTGGTLWEAFPLDSPVYPERGSPAIAGGKLFAATVAGAVVCLDALRGTRVFETRLPDGARVFGAVLPVGRTAKIGDATPTPELLLVPATVNVARTEGAIFVLDAQSGDIRRTVPLRGGTDTAPCFADALAYAHDDAGFVTAFDPWTGGIVWQAEAGAGFDAAPVIADGGVFSANTAGVLTRRDAKTGDLLWQLAVTNAPLSGTPATDASLLYVPADDGLHIVSAATGKSVRRFGARRPVRASPVIAGGGVVFWGGTDGAIYGVRGGGVPETLYDPRTSGAQFALPLCLADGAVIASASNGVLYVLEHGVRQG